MATTKVTRVEPVAPGEVDTRALASRAGDTLKAPRVYIVDSLRECWIAEGTDGCLYTVPVEALGWLRRERYAGPREALRPLPPQVALTTARFVCGDLGRVKIAECPVESGNATLWHVRG